MSLPNYRTIDAVLLSDEDLSKRSTNSKLDIRFVYQLSRCDSCRRYRTGTAKRIRAEKRLRYKDCHTRAVAPEYRNRTLSDNLSKQKLAIRFTDICSDNKTTFVGTIMELKEDLRRWEIWKISDPRKVSKLEGA